MTGRSGGWLWWVLAAVGAGCGSSSGSNGHPASVCAPGQQVACACPGGGSGAQSCKQDGSGYDPCVGCVGADGGSATDAASDAGTSPGHDGGQEAGLDGSPPCPTSQCQASNGTCAPGTSPTNCGGGGTMCVDCTAIHETCLALDAGLGGACVSTASCGTCAINAYCQATCPPAAGGGINCCNAEAGVCYATSQATCP